MKILKFSGTKNFRKTEKRNKKLKKWKKKFFARRYFFEN